MNANKIIPKLKNVSDGLLWMSESDYPFETFLWDIEDLIADKLLQQIERSPDTPIEIVDMDRFFGLAIAEHDWYDEQQIAEVQKYRQLVSELKTNLTDIKVYRVGEVKIDVYVVGKTPDGKVAGLKTQVVET